MKIDATNRKIIKALQEDARLSNVELAEKVGLSQSACFLRHKELVKAGIILRNTAEIDIDRVCHNVQAYVEITLAKNGYPYRQEFESAIRDIPEFMDCLRVSGEVDYISQACCTSMEALNKLCDDLSLNHTNIKNITNRIILDRPKCEFSYPFEKLAWKE